jgi:hypothetical protein
MKNLFYLIILTALFVTAATAQKPFGKSIDSAKTQIDIDIDTPIQAEFRMAGVQSAPGIYDQNSDMYTGNAFVLNGGDENYSTHMTITMDYAGNSAFGASNRIMHGMWTLTVYKKGKYFGVIYGDIYGGNITWEADRSNSAASRLTQAKLRSLGGLDGYAEGFASESPEHYVEFVTQYGDNSSVTEGQLQMNF